MPSDMRRLIETYESTGIVIPLDELPGLKGVRSPPDGPTLLVEE